METITQRIENLLDGILDDEAVAEIDLLQQVKAEYYISEGTPTGRVDWAINDFMRTHELTEGQRQLLLNSSAQEVREA